VIHWSYPSCFFSIAILLISSVFITSVGTSPLFSHSLRAYAIKDNASSISVSTSKEPTIHAVQNQPSILLPSKLHFSPQVTATINSGKAPSISNFNITRGYKIEPVLWNLTLPSSVAFDDKGNMYIAEAGYAYGELETTPRILKIDINGTVSSFVDRDLFGPITDIIYHQGKLYVANRGKISVVENGHVKDTIMGLPSLGDHPIGQMEFGPDGRMYLGIGSATNSGVVGSDNLEWLKLLPTFHDVPAKDVTLAVSQTFESPNLFKPSNQNEKNITLAFSPFGNTSIDNNARSNHVVRGDSHECSACIISAKPDGKDIKLVAWGIRNPYGLTFDSRDGMGNRLIVTDQGAEPRGSRPIANDADKVYSIDISNATNIGKWFGWPDYFGNAEPVTLNKFKVPNSTSATSANAKKSVSFLMQKHPAVEKPLLLTNGLNGIAQTTSSNSSVFGFKGMTFAAEAGQILPTMDNASTIAAKSASSANTSKPENSSSIEKQHGVSGQKIIVFNSTALKRPNSNSNSNNNNNLSKDFIALKKPDPSFRPVSVKFNQDHTAMYIVSMGKEEIRKTLPTTGYSLPKPTPWFYQHTGVVWKVTNASAVVGKAATQPPKKLQLSPELTVTVNSGATPRTDIYNLPQGYKIEPVLWNLDLPGSFAFDGKGNMYIASTGITYGKVTSNPTIFKVDQNGTVSVFADRFLHGVLADIEFDKNIGLMYVSHRALISSINLTSGVVKDLVTGLPMTDYGTHPMGQIAIGPLDGRIYFGVGSVSNTAVPDVSDFGIGWIRDMPQLHEIPGQDIKLTGQNFKSHNFLAPDSNETVITGGFSTFGTPTVEGQTVKGNTKCTSCLLSIKPDGSDLRLHAWGIRNPYGLVIDSKGILFSDSNGDDDKGIRRVTNDPDTIFQLNTAGETNRTTANKDGPIFFGWPDFPGFGQPINESIFNQSPAQNYTNKPLIKNPPQVTKPIVSLGMSVGATQAAISSSNTFGYNGKIFVGEFGTIAPITHKFHIPKNASAGEVMGNLIGQKLVVVDPKTKDVKDFIKLNSVDAAWRPVGLQFTPDGNAMYITSIEKEQIRDVTPSGVPLPTSADWPYLKTGTIWKVTHTAAVTNSSNNNNISNNKNNNNINSTSSGNNQRGEAK
jgi:glucose/arabinose dehydrogenase